jgi:hypothetical protein
MSHINATVNTKNNTIHGGRVAHVGQLYFDQDLVDTVETFPPYNTNKQMAMKNADDFTMASGALNLADPVMEYVLLGKDIRDGVFAWINFGIDSKLNKKVMASAECSAEGCRGSGFMAYLAEVATGNATFTGFTEALQSMGGSAASLAKALTNLVEIFGGGVKASGGTSPKPDHRI